MTGEEKDQECIHFIILGHSREHALRVAKMENAHQMVVFTSKELAPEVGSFIGELEDEGVRVLDLVTLDPFSDNALEAMAETMIRTYGRYRGRGSIKIVSGLTGGTNLMVIAMALLALVEGLECHYVVKGPEERVIHVSLFKTLSQQESIDGVKKVLLGEEP